MDQIILTLVNFLNWSSFLIIFINHVMKHRNLIVVYLDNFDNGCLFTDLSRSNLLKHMNRPSPCILGQCIRRNTSSRRSTQVPLSDFSLKVTDLFVGAMTYILVTFYIFLSACIRS